MNISAIVSAQFQLLQGNHTKDKEPLINLLNDKDTDGNEVLSFEEFGITEDKFKLLDQNKDNSVDLNELTDGHSAAQIKEQLEKLSIGLTNFNDLLNGDFDTQLKQVSDFIMKQKDTNADQTISFSEAGISEEIFAKLDTNSDTLLDDSEFADAFKTEVLKEQLGRLIQGAEHLKASLQNKEKTQAPQETGQTSNQEAKEAGTATEILFNGIDDDNDGEIDEDDSQSSLENILSKLI